MKQLSKDVLRKSRVLLVVAALSASSTGAFAAQSQTAPQAGQGKTQQTNTGRERAKEETQRGSGAQAGQKTPEKGQYSLHFSNAMPMSVSLKAVNAPLADIASEFGRKLEVPFMLSPVMAKQRITLEFDAMPVEAAIRMLSPHPYIDYEVGGNLIQPRVLAVYLHALNEAPPSETATVKSNSEAILIEGDTEEGIEDVTAPKTKEDDLPLLVKFEKNQLSVRARKQPLTVVLYKIADALRVPFDLRADSSEVVDVDFANYPVDQAVRSISPFVRLYYRTDLQTFENQPLRIALEASAKS